MSEKQKKKDLLPELRFPEFQGSGAWKPLALGQVSDRVVEKVGDKILTTVSITAGVGFVSQAEKFSRDISGKQYKNYIVLNKGEYSYNKGNSKKYPQGCVCKLKEFEQVAAPNAFISFRFKNGYVGDFYQGYFEKNVHGKQLARFITSGARSDGLLNINPADFFGIKLPTPPTSIEQKKIADCLSSLEELITAQAKKVEVLKDYKKGLMQQIFPAEGEAVPKLRFPEFQNAERWEEKNLSSCVQLISGLHLAPGEYGETGKLPYFTGPSDFTNSESKISKWTNKLSSRASVNDVLITVKGSGVGELWYLLLPGVAMGRQLMAIRAKDCISKFIYQFLITKKGRFEALGSGNLIPGLSRADILDMPIRIPSQAEQKRIAECLSSIDELIAAQAKKVETLKDHRNGLMQKLFPSLDGAEA